MIELSMVRGCDDAAKMCLNMLGIQRMKELEMFVDYTGYWPN